MNYHHVFGIDMGTGQVKIYDQADDTIKKEMNMIAVRNKNTVFAVGNDAYDMYEKTPENIEIITPMGSGRINNVLMMEAVLHTLLGRTAGSVGMSPILYFSVPVDMTEIERRAYTTIACKGRFRKAKVFMVEKPIADAITFGIPLQTTEGCILVNIGAQCTEVSVIADKRVIFSSTIPVGGQTFSTAIVEGIRRKNNFLVSTRTAQRLKITLTSLDEEVHEGCKVIGIDTTNGLPRDGIVSSANVSACVEEKVEEIVSELIRILERIPPQVRLNALSKGLYFTGGSMRIPGIREYFSYRLGCPIIVSGHYEMSTIYGLKEIINNDRLQHWVYIPGKKTRER
jgi:rod shape-determining protein MreB